MSKSWDACTQSPTSCQTGINFSKEVMGLFLNRGSLITPLVCWKALDMKPTGTVRNRHLSWKDFPYASVKPVLSRPS